jgi:hypothetical protein
MKWMFLFLLSFVLSFGVYRMTDEELNETALELSKPLPQVLPELKVHDFKTDLSQFPQNLCASETEAEDQKKFINLWEGYTAERLGFFKHLLEVWIQMPITHSADSILGHQDAMLANLQWIRHFEHQICYYELTGKKNEAIKFLKIFMSSVLKSFEFAQPFAQSVQSVRLLSSALIEIEKYETTSGFEEQILNLDIKTITHLSDQFHFQSVINSLENLKDKMKLSPKVYIPAVMIQPGRLKNQMAQITLSLDLQIPQVKPDAAWYDVRNLELIYLSMFQKAVMSQRETLDSELFSLKELATDLSRKSDGLENDKSKDVETK